MKVATWGGVGRVHVGVCINPNHTETFVREGLFHSRNGACRNRVVAANQNRKFLGLENGVEHVRSIFEAAGDGSDAVRERIEIGLVQGQVVVHDVLYRIPLQKVIAGFPPGDAQGIKAQTASAGSCSDF